MAFWVIFVLPIITPSESMRNIFACRYGFFENFQMIGECFLSWLNSSDSPFWYDWHTSMWIHWSAFSSRNCMISLSVTLWLYIRMVFFASWSSHSIHGRVFIGESQIRVSNHHENMSFFFAKSEVNISSKLDKIKLSSPQAINSRFFVKLV